MSAQPSPFRVDLVAHLTELREAAGLESDRALAVAAFPELNWRGAVAKLDRVKAVGWYGRHEVAIAIAKVLGVEVWELFAWRAS